MVYQTFVTGVDCATTATDTEMDWVDNCKLATRGRARSVVALAPAGGWEPGSRAERRLRTLFIRNHKLLSYAADVGAGAGGTGALPRCACRESRRPRRRPRVGHNVRLGERAGRCGEVTDCGTKRRATCSTGCRADAISKRARRSRRSRRPPGVDTERAQNLRSASISATQRHPPRIPCTPAMTAPLASREIFTSPTSHDGD